MSIIPVFIPHLGCPHQCTFCNQRTISGQHTSALTGAQEQIDRWLQWVKPSVDNEAAFYGGSFTALDRKLQAKLLALSDELLARGIIGSVRLSTRPDYMDGDIAAFLREHGVRTVELGAQSLDDAVLEQVERGHTAQDVVKAVAVLKQAGLRVGLQLMVGLPGQSEESMRATAQLAASLKPDIARIYPLLVVKGTPLVRSYEAGEFVPLSLEEAVRQSAYMYKTLTEVGVQVIRVGLQPDEELCEPGNILAGPFHPAMGELVQSYLLREKLTPRIGEKVEKFKKDSDIPNKKITPMAGKNRNTQNVPVGSPVATDGTNYSIEPLATDANKLPTILITCPPKLESKLRGQRNSNLHYWEETFHCKIEIVATSEFAVEILLK